MNDQDRHHHEVQSEQEYLESLMRRHPILGTWPGRSPAPAPTRIDPDKLRDAYEVPQQESKK